METGTEIRNDGKSLNDEQFTFPSHSGDDPGSENSNKLKQTRLNRRLKFPLCSFIVQAIFIVLLSKFADYPDDANATLIKRCHLFNYNSRNTVKNYTSLGFTLNFTNHKLPTECEFDAEAVNVFGSPYQDAQFFIITGLTLLFLGIRHHSLTTMALSIFVISICLQWAFLCRGLIRLDSQLHPIKPSPDVFVITVFFAAAVLISWGIILGRVSKMQILAMSVIEIPIAIINDYIILDVFKVSDPGGALIYNIFGTYYGLGVSKMLYVKGEKLNEEKRESTINSETLAFIGSNILWSFWPTSMGAIFTKGHRLRCILNTYFALTGSGVAGTIFGVLLDPEGKLTASHVQNAILAGAVAMSGAADTMLGLYASVIVGCSAGIISIITSVYIQPFLAIKWNIVDTCGSHTLHGMPAILGVIVSAMVACVATEEQYGISLYTIFPAMAPKRGTEDLLRVQALWPQILPGEGRTGVLQAAYHIACMLITFLIAISSGLLTGWLIKHNCFDPLLEEEFYQDSVFWNMPKGEPTITSTAATAYGGNTDEDISSITTNAENAFSNMSTKF